MPTNTKTENGIRYTIRRRRDNSMTEYGWYWEAEDGSILEMTEDEALARANNVRAITDL